MSGTAGAPEAHQSVRVEPAQLALLWQLAARARAAANEQALGFTIVNETLTLAPYRQAAWWRGPAPGAVAAVSGLPQSDPGAPYVQWLTSLCRVLARGTREASNTGHPGDGGSGAGAVVAQAHAARSASGAAAGQSHADATQADSTQASANPAGANPAGHGADMPSVRGLRTFTAADLPAERAIIAAEWEAWWPAHGLWVPLYDRNESLLGGLVFARDEPWSQTELALLSELSQAWAHAFAAFGPRASWNVQVRKLLKPGRNQRRALIVLALLCIVPVRLTVLASAEVTAKDPFVVRAPLDGVIDHLYVQPNQKVAPGTPLLGLDATTVQSRYAVAHKDFDTAQEEYRQTAQLAVTSDKDRLDMAQRKGKLDESAIELDYSAQQLARVRVLATRAGVAVFADQNDWNGKAVAVGEKIMLLADPASVELSAYLPVADNVDIKPGGTLTLYPKSSPLSAYEAHIDTVAYRAEPTPEGILAYRIKASFAPGAVPTLGTMGTARIHSGWVPLAYYVLRRPLTLARQWLGW
jgi:hypothetical protein